MPFLACLFLYIWCCQSQISNNCLNTERCHICLPSFSEIYSSPPVNLSLQIVWYVLILRHISWWLISCFNQLLVAFMHTCLLFQDSVGSKTSRHSLQGTKVAAGLEPEACLCFSASFLLHLIKTVTLAYIGYSFTLSSPFSFQSILLNYTDQVKIFPQFWADVSEIWGTW